MKKSWMLLAVIGIAMGIFLGSLAFAEDDMSEMRNDGRGKGKMMGMMHQDSLVATSDGGGVVLQGPRLIKYDKDLNLVKETELPRGKKPGNHEMDNDQSEEEMGE